MFGDADYYMEIFVGLIGGVILFMAISTILLLRNWKKWTPIFKKIGSFLVLLYFSAMFFLLLYKIISENWMHIYETLYYYYNSLVSIIIIPFAILLLIAQYVIIYLIFNEYASVANNPDEGEVRSSAIIIATVAIMVVTTIMMTIMMTIIITTASISLVRSLIRIRTRSQSQTQRCAA